MNIPIVSAFVDAFSRLITYFGDLFGGDFGLSVILLTLLIRAILMPLMWRQYRSGKTMQAKMKAMQPELEKLKDKFKDRKDADSQRLMQQEMLQVYQRHQFNPLAIGCLPMLIQLPFLMGFYYAIRHTPEIGAHPFLWFNLGHTDPIMPIVAAAIYFVQARVGLSIQAATPGSPNAAGPMKWLIYLSPVMIGIFSFQAPAVMPLYWSAGGLFLIGQSLLFDRIYRTRHLNAEPQVNT